VLFTKYNIMSLFALVDCDNFYCSCERVFEPSLKNKPVAVLSNNDGCIIARSQEVKDFGIKMGDPYYKVSKFLNARNSTVFSSNYELYGSMSQRVIRTLRTFSQNIEVYSIDECFVELSENNVLSLEAISNDIVRRVKQWTGIPVKVGIAYTKTLAKAAAELVKKQKIKLKYCVLTDAQKIQNELKTFPVGDIWGVGAATTKKLHRIGIKTALQLINLDDEYIRNKYGVLLLKTVKELRGESCYNLETVPETRKSLCYSRSFSNSITKYSDLKESIVYYASRASEKLRRDKLTARAVTVFVRTNFFNKKQSQYSNSVTVALPYSAGSNKMIVEYARDGLNKIFREGYFYKKSGIILSDLADENIIQPDFFLKPNKKDDNLSKIMDDINKKFGKGSVQLAGEGIGKKWDMSRNMLSKRYTNDWNELLKIE
jgi:DNA polymerase V